MEANRARPAPRAAGGDSAPASPGGAPPISARAEIEIAIGAAEVKQSTLTPGRGEELDILQLALKDPWAGQPTGDAQPMTARTEDRGGGPQVFENCTVADFGGEGGYEAYCAIQSELLGAADGGFRALAGIPAQAIYLKGEQVPASAILGAKRGADEFTFDVKASPAEFRIPVAEAPLVRASAEDQDLAELAQLRQQAQDALEAEVQRELQEMRDVDAAALGNAEAPAEPEDPRSPAVDAALANAYAYALGPAEDPPDEA